MTSELLTKSVLFGLGGICVGGLRLLGQLVTDTETPVQLCATYQHLQRDVLLLDILQALDADFQTIDLVAGIKIVDAVDQLLGVRYALEDAVKGPVLSDRINGIIHFRKAKQAIQRFITRAEQVHQPRNVIYMQRYAEAAMRQLDLHLQYIVMATRDVFLDTPTALTKRHVGDTRERTNECSREVSDLARYVQSTQ